MFKQETTLSQTLPNCRKGKIYTQKKRILFGLINRFS